MENSPAGRTSHAIASRTGATNWAWRLTRGRGWTSPVIAEQVTNGVADPGGAALLLLGGKPNDVLAG